MVEPSSIGLSIVAPARNEATNLAALVAEIVAAVTPLGVTYEIIVVDDGSTDDTPEILRALLTECPHLRPLRVEPRGHGRRMAGNGQSAAFAAAFREARGRIIASLDADLQNDPADLPALLAAMQDHGADLVQGDRSAARSDGAVRRATSRVGRLARRLILADTTRDTGCSLRIMRREVAIALAGPLEFAGMHRFIPVTARDLGFSVVEVPVRHRPRRAGRSAYGILDRGLSGLVDCFAVRWMRARRRRIDARPLERELPGAAAPPRPTPAGTAR
jgi:glycosyltransferase involved in cell wall biosynthesis